MDAAGRRPATGSPIEQAYRKRAMSMHCKIYEHGPFRGLCLGIAVVLVLLMAGAPAWAQAGGGSKTEAMALFKKGRTQYDLGNFDEAVSYFKQAYEALPHEAFLFNIAQAYRQMGDCKNGLFFYKRYLTVAGENGKNSDLVRAQIKELEESCRVIDDMKNQEPLGAMEPGGGDGDQGGGDAALGSNAPGNMVEPGGSTGGGSASGKARGGETSRATRAGRSQRSALVASSLELGPAFLDVGDLDITGAQFSISIGAGYPLELGKVGVTVGGMLTYTPVPWSNGQTGTSGTSSLTTLLLNVGARYWILDGLAVRGELGVGGLFLGGLEEGNVFVPPGTMATGVLSMLNVRVGVGAEYQLTDHLVLSASPLVYSHSAAKEGLRREIDGFTRFELIAGIGYRL